MWQVPWRQKSVGDERGQLGKPRLGWDDNIEVDFKEI